MDFGNLEGVLAEKGSKFKFVKPEASMIALSESDPKGKMEVRLTEAPGTVLAIKVPQNQQAYLQEPYAKACDYFIVVPRGDTTDVVLCEMKKKLGDDNLRYAFKQIKCSIPLFWYIKAVLTEHFDEGGEIRMHFAVITECDDTRMLTKRVPYPGGPVVSYKYGKYEIRAITAVRGLIPLGDLTRP